MKTIFTLPLLSLVLLSSCNFSDIDRGKPISYEAAKEIASDIFNKTIDPEQIMFNKEYNHISVFANDSTYLKEDDYIAFDYSYSFNSSDEKHEEKEMIKCSNKEKFLYSDASYLREYIEESTTETHLTDISCYFLIDQGELCYAIEYKNDNSKVKAYYPISMLERKNALLWYCGYNSRIWNFRNNYFVCLPLGLLKIANGLDIGAENSYLVRDKKIMYARSFYSNGKGNLTAIYNFKSLDGRSYYFNFCDHFSVSDERKATELDLEISFNDYKPYRYVFKNKNTDSRDSLTPYEINMSIQISYDKFSPRSINLNEYPMSVL